ncbi:hypothetical protein CQW23_07770 [Capsicum baccatum]|uniref:F-box associated beta-propeller type 1 domain-containing protein n=1 Tax=Capsicum baccatum TaxID=33114 RepID=A0A2G2X721_CAPBA|nr:hypothetical protein CQW23_07770 [Capsicum baccatum]
MNRIDGPPNYSIRCFCDGLALLSFSDEKTDLMSILLWNPSTRESILLPSRECGFRFWAFGLGYDATSDDYKILAAYLDAGSVGVVSVQILSLKSGSWRKIDKYPTGMRPASGYSDRAMSSLSFVHGAFHWLSYKSPCYTIISFNISNEVYGEIPLLDWMYHMHMFKLDHCVQVLRGMLCYYNTHSIEGRPSTFKLWTMKDYGIKESWIQWLAIRDIGVGSAIPHCVFADGETFGPEMYSAKLSGYLFHGLGTETGPESRSESELEVRNWVDIGTQFSSELHHELVSRVVLGSYSRWGQVSRLESRSRFLI